MFRPSFLLLCALPLVLACTTDGTLDDDDHPADCSDGGDYDDLQLSGMFYVDGDSSDASIHEAGFDADADTPIAGGGVQLIGADGIIEGTSCEGGDFHFGDLDDGVYVVQPELDIDGNCMQRNCAQRFPTAIAEGSVKIVTMGDSVPVVGDDTLFPSRLALLLGSLADVDNTNVAVGGTVSSQWLPGSSNFENRLAPELPDADVVVMSIGGNDIMASLDAGALSDPEGTIAETYELVEQIAENVLAMVEAMRDINPDLDIVYCIYVDYGQSTVFPWGLVGNLVGAEAITDVLRTARDSLSVEEDVLIADLFGASHELEDSLDEYLADMLHFNDRGHTLYAEEIFLTLGGALLGDSPLGGGPRSPLGLEQSWSLAPE